MSMVTRIFFSQSKNSWHFSYSIGRFFAYFYFVLFQAFSTYFFGGIFLLCGVVQNSQTFLTFSLKYWNFLI